MLKPFDRVKGKRDKTKKFSDNLSRIALESLWMENKRGEDGCTQADSTREGLRAVHSVNDTPWIFTLFDQRDHKSNHWIFQSTGPGIVRDIGSRDIPEGTCHTIG